MTILFLTKRVSIRNGSIAADVRRDDDDGAAVETNLFLIIKST